MARCIITLMDMAFVFDSGCTDGVFQTLVMVISMLSGKEREESVSRSVSSRKRRQLLFVFTSLAVEIIMRTTG